MNLRDNSGVEKSTSVLDLVGWTEDGKRDWRTLMIAVSTPVQADPSNPVMGNPSKVEPTARHSPAVAVVSSKSRRDSAKNSANVPWPVILAAAVVLGLASLLWAWLSAPPTFSPDVVSRAAAATEAFFDEDVETLHLLAVPGTETDLEAWLALARPKGWRLRVDHRQQPTANIKSEDSRQGTALVYGRLYLKPGVIQTAKADDYLPMIWRRMPDGQWKLDGGETRKATPAATKKMPSE